MIAILLAWPACAAPLGGKVEVTPVPGWTFAAKPEQAPLPTLRLQPTDGRNATVLLTLFPAARLNISDAASLRKFHRMACTPFLPTPTTEVRPIEIKLPGGIGVYASFEDPSLVGKPSRPGDYKNATSACLYLGHDIVVQATIFCDDTSSTAFTEALTIVRTVAVIAQADANKPAASLVASPAPGTSAISLRPPAGFIEADFNASAAPGYFSYVRSADAVMLSGWLDQAAKFKGMRTFWAAEKASLESKLGVKIANESFKIVAGWSVVSYDLPIGATAQKNIRACRVYGGTWVDVHLSQTSDTASTNNLEAVLAEIKVEPAAR